MKQYKPGELFEGHKAKVAKKHKHSAAAVGGLKKFVAEEAKEKKTVKKEKTHKKAGVKNWIAGAIKKPGALHRELGVKKGTKIPAGKLAAAAKKGGVEGKRANLAITLRGMKKSKKCGK